MFWSFNLDRMIFTLESNATEDQSIADGFTLSPNPADTQLQVKLPVSLDVNNSVLQFYAASGAKVAQYQVTSALMNLDVSELPSGAYFLRMTDGEKSYIRRLVIR